MSGCQSCDSCQHNTCSFCNSCQACDTNCNGSSCNSSQAFCSNGKQSAGGFSFGQCVSSNELFLSKANWNKLLSYINAAYAKGSASVSNKARSGSGVTSGSQGGSSGVPSSDSNTFMTASMFNAVSSALGKLGSAGPGYYVYPVGSTAKPEGDIVLGSYFEGLQKYANNLQLKTTQCDDCNAGCNTQCNTCLKCDKNDNCGKCDGACQSNSPSSCCSSCNSSCNSGNTTKK